MTFHNLATPFYTLGRYITLWAADTRPKLQIQNLCFNIIYCIFNNFPHPQESHNSLGSTNTPKIASAKNVFFFFFFGDSLLDCSWNKCLVKFTYDLL